MDKGRAISSHPGGWWGAISGRSHPHSPGTAPIASRPCALLLVRSDAHDRGCTTMEQIAELLTEPVMPWDALVCTSTAVAETARIVRKRRRSSSVGALVTACASQSPKWLLFRLAFIARTLLFRTKISTWRAMHWVSSGRMSRRFMWAASHLAARLTRSKCIRAFRPPPREHGGASS